MGSSINGITGSLVALRSSPDFGQVRLDAQRDPLNLPGARQADDDGRGPFFNRQEPRQVNVGFGQGLSIQGAALRTINTTIELTRRTMPTMEEIRKRFIITSSVRRDQAQRTSAEQVERTLTRRVESRIPEASAQARKFISDVEEAAGEEQVRFEESETEEEVTTPTIQSNDEQAGFGSSENESRRNEARLDVQV